MKKLVFLFICLFTLQTVAKADNDKPIQVEQMPQQAQTLIKQFFPSHKVAIAKMESGIFDKSYEVIFTDGNKIEFDKKGNWKEVDCKHGFVPEKLIPVAIRNYVITNYPNTSIIKIDKDSKDYEVKLSNRIELKFDLKYNLIDLDN